MDTALASSLAIGYLLGAIPVGIFAGRALGGIDPRDAGSRNIGFTNVLRVAGNADRKSTRLNSSHGYISYAVFCLKKKKKRKMRENQRRNHYWTDIDQADC